MGEQTVMVPIESKHPAHANMFKTLVLLAIDTQDGPVFFVVRGSASFEPLPKLQENSEYFYEEHTCPTNFIDIEAVCFKGDMDPHGVFRHVRSVWMPAEYAADDADRDGMLLRLFPELLEGALAPAIPHTR